MTAVAVVAETEVASLTSVAAVVIGVTDTAVAEVMAQAVLGGESAGRNSKMSVAVAAALDMATAKAAVQ